MFEVRDDFGITGFGVILVIIFAMCVIMGFGVSMSWISAGKEARLLNKEYATNYTTSDIFWCGSTVEQIIIGSKHRVDMVK